MVKDVPRNVPLIHWNENDRMINTEYGNITYKEFCIKEVKRRGHGCKVYTDGCLICADQ